MGIAALHPSYACSISSRKTSSSSHRSSAAAAIAKAQEELAAAEDRWLELEVLREEIEQA